MLLLAGAAWAGGEAEPFDLGDVARIARTSGVSLAQSYVGGPTDLWFADVVAGTTLVQGARGRVGLAASVGFGSLLVAVPDEDRSALLGRPLSFDARVWFAGKRPATLHAVGLRTALPTSGAHTYLWAVDDAALLVGADYVGNLDFEGLDVRMALGAGFGSIALFDGHGALGLAVELGDAFALTVGANAGVGPLWERAGVRWRPTGFLEAGADLSVALWTPPGWDTVPEGEWPVVPTLTLRGFAAESPASAR